VVREEVYVRVRWPFRSAERWYREYRRAWNDLEHGPLEGVERAYDRRVLASWGLSVRARDALPFALDMLRSPNAEIRADATSVLTHVKDDPAAVSALLAMLEEERELEALDATLVALAQVRPPEAVPHLARLVRDESLDEDTRFTAAQSLGTIVGKRFRGDRTLEDALAWLDRAED